MKYSVVIRNNATGEERNCRQERIDWDNDSFWWLEGNMSCDCNREREWLRAGGPAPDGDPFWNDHDAPCGEGRFSALRAILDNDEIIELEA